MTTPFFQRVLWSPLLTSLCILGFLAMPVSARTDEEKKFAIPASTADRSLKQFAAQSGVEVVYSAEVVRGVRTPEVKGSMKPTEAMKRLLEGTGLGMAQDRKSGAFSISRRIFPNG